jgi:hypothetical protein
MVDHNVKVTPSATCVSAANAIRKDIDIFNKYFITLTDLS